MVLINIQGMPDGVSTIHIEKNVDDVEGIFPEFFGIVRLEGELRKFKNRFSFHGTVSSKAKLVCDRSLKEFTEEISSEIKIAFIKDTELYRIAKERGDESRDENIIHEDEKHLNLTEEIAQQLAVMIPMKKIAPEFRKKELDDIYPEVNSKSNKIDDRWEGLKNLKLN